MFASHFGMNGQPFQLSPDPGFYFDSHGHHRALAALRRGLSQPSGFTVISGDVGAGKTTVVHAVLRDLDPAFFAVAQIVSTQLDAVELLRAITIGFALPAAGGLLGLTANLRRFLVGLRAQRRRAVLVIDEAQNLHTDAFDQLVAFAMRGAPSGRGMQICLVGQPELQAMVDTADLLPIREQICVQCHLGPLEREETMPYVEHRLRKVGWKGRPSFDAGAFDEIYRWTEGIPRRINMLCSRLLSARLADDDMTIEAASVARVARQQRSEIGEAIVEPPALPRAPPRNAAPAKTPKPRAMLCLVASLGDHVRAAALMAAMAERVGWSAMQLVRVHDDDSFALSGTLFDGLDPDNGLINLGCTRVTQVAGQADLKRKFELVMDRTPPRAIVVFEASEAVLACSAVARARGVPIVHAGTGLHGDLAQLEGAGGRRSTAAPADLWYTTDDRARQALANEGVPLARIHCVGNLLVDAVRIASRSLRDPRLCGACHRIVVPFRDEGGRYALVLIDEARQHLGDRESFVTLFAFLRRISHSTALVLLMHSDLEREFNKHGFHQGILGERVCYLPAQAYPNRIELLRNAMCAITDSLDLRDEAVAFDVPCLAIGVRGEPEITEPVPTNAKPGDAAAAAKWAVWQRGAEFSSADDAPKLRDDLVGARIAEHLCSGPETSGNISSRLVTGTEREQFLTSSDRYPLLRDRIRRVPQ